MCGLLARSGSPTCGEHAVTDDISPPQASAEGGSARGWRWRKERRLCRCTAWVDLRCACECQGSGRRPLHLRRARDHADRHYAQPLDLDELAAVGGLSKYHFLRLFKATYGVTPAEYVSQRRIERAQDLLRSTNLTVTEVCHAVGFSSLGSFSSRFRELVGESAERRSSAATPSGAPHIPGCFIFMWGLAERDARSAIEEKPTRTRPARSVDPMITNISIVSVFVKDVDESKRFYTDVLGFEEKDDITLGDGYRWCTVVHPTSPSCRSASPSPGRRSRPSSSPR